MTIDYLLLHTLHRILRQQTDLRDRIARGPKKVLHAENNEKGFEKSLSDAKATLLQTRKLANEKQLQLDSREAKIEDMKNKRNACDSNREFQLLNEQIAADEQANNVLSDEILELLERIDGLVGEQNLAEENLSKAQEETKVVKDRVDKELDDLNRELERVTGELKETEKRIPLDIKTEYKRLVTANGESALAETDMETCLNCYRTLTRQIVDQLLLQKPIFCQGCGSLMYRVLASKTGS